MSRLLPAVIALLIALPAFAQQEPWKAKIDTTLWQKLAVPGATSEFLIILNQQADLSKARTIPRKADKGKYVYETLMGLAEKSQPPVRALLQQTGVPAQSYWVINALWAIGNADLVEQLAKMPQVARVEDNPQWHLSWPPPNEPESLVDDRSLLPISWGLTKINADDVWDMGYKGQGVVVGGQDTGYEWQHPALKNKYRGWDGATANHNYNWHDAIHALIGAGGNSCGLNLNHPCDDDNHGTHTMGTMVGGVNDDSIVGVAPEAKWIGCRNMEEGDGTPSTYIECFQWFIAPTNLSNNSPDPSMAPDVINNSWGCPTSEGCNTTNFATMNTVVNNVRNAGILIAVSAGNSGPACSSINTPAAIFEGVFTVGATSNTDVIASFSSRGPVTNFGTHSSPDISAPGVNIISSIGHDNNSSTHSYASFSGTSMAGPHIAGVTALLLSARPDLAGQVDVLEDLMQSTAVPRFATAPFCGGNNSTTLPNNVYGYGRVNALAAVTAALALPVEFVRFTAKAVGKEALLEWSTASEDDCAYFEIQRSINGFKWEALAQVSCHGPGDYSFTDRSPLSGANYYRLKQTDWSGRSDYTQVVALSFSPSGISLQLTPQPADQALYVHIIGKEQEGAWPFEVLGMDGRFLLSYSLENSGLVPLPQLPAGLYLGILRDAGGRVVGVEKWQWKG